MIHFEGEENKRQLKGKKRKLLREKLKSDLPSNAFRKNFSTANVAKIQKGNYNEVKNRKVYQQVRVEVCYLYFTPLCFDWFLTATNKFLL